MADKIVANYIANLGAVTVSRSPGARSLVDGALSGADLSALQADIMNTITDAQLLNSNNVDQILASMMEGVAKGIQDLASAGLSGDYAAQSIVIEIAIKSSVQSLAAYPTSLSSASVTATAVVGSIVSAGVASLSDMASADPQSVQLAIAQSVQDVATASSSLQTGGVTAADFIGAAVSATVQVTAVSQSTAAQNLMQAAFSEASAALDTATGGNSTEMSTALTTIVTGSIAAAAAAASALPASTLAQNVLTQAAIGLTSASASTLTQSTSAAAAIIQGAAAQASTAADITLDAASATSVAVETPPSAVLAAMTGGSVVPVAGLPFREGGYAITVSSSGSTTTGTVISITCPGVDTSSFADGTWTGTLYSGVYTFTLTVADSPGVKVAYATATIRIVAGSTSVPVTGVNLSASELSLTAGGATAKLAATISPAGATNRSISWSSSDPTVATVNAVGLVTPVGAGTATITVKTVDGGFTDLCAVAVSAAGSIAVSAQ